jgi:DNA-binding NarL/FixJ family response regulator
VNGASAVRAGLPPEGLRVHVSAADARVRDGVATKLRRVGIAVTPEPDRSPGAVVLTAADTVHDAIEATPPACRSGDYRLVVVADTFRPAEVRRAVRLGARVMVRSAGASSTTLAAAVRSAGHGEGRLPYEVLVRMLGDQDGAPRPGPSPRPLTARQTTVLALMAEGHGNEAIARELGCSEHTVKNVIHDLTSRLQVRNRAHAVAYALRTGLI